MEESINPIISIGPVIFNLTMLAMTLLIVGVIFVFIYWASRNMTLKPKGKQNVLEYVYDFVIGFTEPNIGSRYMKDYSLFFLKSSVGQSENVLEKGASKRFILPTMLNSLMKIIASTRSRDQA
ncbi:ATP synthase F0 subunit A [Streptococcus pneumoniae]|nr:ATP synthase F0 subunit A [Streptococcus pneumoniae]